MVSHNKKLSTQGLVLPQAMVEESIYRCGIGGLEPWGGGGIIESIAVLFQVIQTSSSSCHGCLMPRRRSHVESRVKRTRYVS